MRGLHCAIIFLYSFLGGGNSGFSAKGASKMDSKRVAQRLVKLAKELTGASSAARKLINRYSRETEILDEKLSKF